MRAFRILAFIPSIYALGTVSIHNACQQPSYFWVVEADSLVAMQTLNPAGWWSEEFRQPSKGGVSIKLALNPSLGSPITQLEYTVADQIYYDISNIDGYPFMQWGVELVPSGAECPTKTCPAGVASCQEAYNQPDDNFAMGACNLGSSLDFHLCLQAVSTASIWQPQATDDANINVLAQQDPPASGLTTPMQITEPTAKAATDKEEVEATVTVTLTQIVTLTSTTSAPSSGAARRLFERCEGLHASEW